MADQEWFVRETLLELLAKSAFEWANPSGPVGFRFVPRVTLSFDNSSSPIYDAGFEPVGKPETIMSTVIDRQKPHGLGTERFM